MTYEQVLPEKVRTHPAWLRLEDQLSWYDRKSLWNQKWYKGLRIIQIVLATSIPPISLVDVTFTKWVLVAFGGIIAVSETIQHLYQFSTLWIEYRSTAEYLKHEKFLFLSASGPYRELSQEKALRLLAERIEEHISKEHARWVNVTKEAGEKETQTDKT
jgi:hypothetical protein